MLRILYTLCLFFALGAALPAQTNKKIQSLQRQQKTLKKKIASQEQMLKTTKKDVNSQLANLQVINVQIEGQQKYVNGIHSELTELATNISGLEQQLRMLELDLADCKRRYQRSVSYMFRNRMQLSKWQFILSAKNFRQMYRRMRYMTEFSRYQRIQAETIRRKEAQVQAKRNELMGVKTEKNRLLEEGKAETRKLQTQQQERQQVVNDLNKRQSELQASIAQQRKKAAALNARIDQLIQQEIIAAERRRKAELARQAKIKAAREKAAREKVAREKAAREKAAREKAAAERRATATVKKKNDEGKSIASNKRSTTSTRRNAATSSSSRRTAPSRAENPREEKTPSFNEADNADRVINGSFAPIAAVCPCLSREDMPLRVITDLTTFRGSMACSLIVRVSISQDMQVLMLAPFLRARLQPYSPIVACTISSCAMVRICRSIATSVPPPYVAASTCSAVSR